MFRQPTAFIWTILNERGEELLYAWIEISDMFRDEVGVGRVVSLLLFKRRLREYATRFLLRWVLRLMAFCKPPVSG